MHHWESMTAHLMWSCEHANICRHFEATLRNVFNGFSSVKDYRCLTRLLELNGSEWASAGLAERFWICSHGGAWMYKHCPRVNAQNSKFGASCPFVLWARYWRNIYCKGLWNVDSIQWSDRELTQWGWRWQKNLFQLYCTRSVDNFFYYCSLFNF